MAILVFKHAHTFLFSFSGFLVLSVLLYIVHCLIQYVRLRQFKGPQTVGFSKIWLLRSVTSGMMHHHFLQVNRKYGSTARIGPQTLLTCDVELIHRMNAPRSSYRRSDWYTGSRFVPGEDSLLSEVDEAQHKKLRAAMTPAYAINGNDALEHGIDRQLTTLLDLIKSKYVSPSSSTSTLMDWGMKASFFTVDSITDVTFGEPVGDLAEDADKFEFLSNTESSLPIVSVFTCYTWMLKLLQIPVFHKLIAPSPEERSGFGRIMGFARDAVRQRFGPTKVVRQDMLGAFIRHGLSQSEAEANGILQLVAGSDPVATTLRAAVLYISTRPAVLSALRSELYKHNLKPNSPATSIISNKEARAIPYLVACVKEVLRIHPPIVGLLEKQVGPQGDTLPDGRSIPSNTKIGVSIWAIQRDQHVYGEDADVFRPERWLEVVEEERRRRMERSLGLVFSGGRFTCIGKELAITQCLKVLAELFSRFDIEIVNPERPWHSVAYGIFCQYDQWVRIAERKNVKQVAEGDSEYLN
ncbi:hypothetical protein MMC22_009187 [Lobaria immixta]|nr:hypothetical protein [Lobaria immixta]